MKTAEQELHLIEFLETFLPVVNSKIPTEVNAGGCGIFAKYLYLNLKELGFEPKLFYVNTNDQMDNLKYTIANNAIKDKHTGILHCYVRISEFIFVDSDGIEMSPVLATKHSDDKVSGEISFEILDTLINNIPSWNPIFDRDCEEIIKTELGKLSEELTKFEESGKLELELFDGIRLTNKTIKARRERSGMDILSRILG